MKAREEAEEQREVLSKKTKTGTRRGNGDVDTRHDDGEKLEIPMFPMRRADTQVPISGRGSQGCAAGDYRGGLLGRHHQDDAEDFADPEALVGY